MSCMERAAALLPVMAIALAMGTGCKQKAQPSPDDYESLVAVQAPGGTGEITLFRNGHEIPQLA